MTTKNARKLGFFSALSICVGSIVGIGIFLKNANVGKNVEGNGISWLLTWIISGIIALLVAIHFGYISRIETKNNACGLSTWTDHIFKDKQKWFKKLVSFNYSFTYIAILTISLSFFTTELLIDFFNTFLDKKILLDVWTYVLISFVFMGIFILINYLSIKTSGFISIMTTVLKFLPLIITILVGIIFANNHNFNDANQSGQTITENGFEKEIDFTTAIKGITLSIPGVLFAFDSFVGIGVMSKQVKGGKKTVSKVIVFGICLVTIIYLLICVASIFHYNSKEGTTVLNVLLDSLPRNSKQAITIFVSFFLFVSAFGTSNSIIGVGVKEFQTISESNKFIFSKYLCSKFGSKIAGLLIEIAALAFWSLIMFIPSMILNTDSIIDGFSNLVVIYFFAIYAYIIFNFWKNIWTKDEEMKQSMNKYWYATLVFGAIFGVCVGLGLNIFFVIYEGTKYYDNNASWGLLLSGGEYWSIKNLHVLIIYICISPLLFLLPQMNFYLIKKIDNVVIY